MSDLVNVFGVETVNTLRIDYPFVPGAWIDLKDDISYTQAIRAQKMVKENDLRLDFVIPQIIDWNFAELDAQGNPQKMPITEDSLGKLGVKKLRWFFEQIFNSVKAQEEEEKKSTS